MPPRNVGQIWLSPLVPGDAMGRDCILVHVDERGSVPGSAEAPALRHCSDENEMSVLDGFHVDFVRYAVLSASPGLLQTSLQQGSSHMHARLGEYGGLYGYTRNFSQYRAKCYPVPTPLVPDWFPTLLFQVLVPSLITIIYTYWYIFLMMRRLRNGVPIHDKEYATALAENLANPSHVMSFVLVAVFWISWTPYAGVRLYEYFTGNVLQVSGFYPLYSHFCTSQCDASWERTVPFISIPYHTPQFSFRHLFPSIV